ncbi:MAG: hypothetical protein ACLPXB_07525, partial [Thiobacillaceae bacterium]
PTAKLELAEETQRAMGKKGNKTRLKAARNKQFADNTMRQVDTAETAQIEEPESPTWQPEPNHPDPLTDADPTSDRPDPLDGWDLEKGE